MATALVVVLVTGAVLFLANRDLEVTEPGVGDHWHVTYRVEVCGRTLSPLLGGADQGGIHSHDDGVIHVEPTRPSSARANATFRRFEEAHGLRISGSRLRWLDGSRPVDVKASDGCDGQEAEIVSFVNGQERVGAPGSIRLRDGQTIVVSLLPVRRTPPTTAVP